MADFNTDRQVTFQELVDSGQYEAGLIDEIVRNAVELAEKLQCNPLTKKNTVYMVRNGYFALLDLSEDNAEDHDFLLYEEIANGEELHGRTG